MCGSIGQSKTKCGGPKFPKKNSLPGNFSGCKISLYINFAVCLYPINVKTAEQIGPKFCVEPNMTPGKISGFLEI